MEATIGDAGVDTNFIKRLDDSTTIQVLQYLDKISDVANASCVCRSWRRCGPCRKFFHLTLLLLMESCLWPLHSNRLAWNGLAADDVQTFAVCAKLHLL